MLVRNGIVPSSVKGTVHAGTELIAATFENITITSIYKPPPAKLTFPPDFFDMNQNNIIIGDFKSATICGDIVTMTRMACSSRSGSPRTTSISPTTPSCRTLSTAGGGSEATTLILPACHGKYETYVIGECTTTYLAHNTALMGLPSTQRSPLRSSLSAAATTSERPNGNLSPLPLTMASPLCLAIVECIQIIQLPSSCVCQQMHPSWLQCQIHIRPNPRIW